MKRVFGLHLLANAALILLLYVWLGIRDARPFQIALTVVLGTVMIASAVWLHAGTLYWMRTASWRVPREIILRFAGGVLLFCLALWVTSLLPVDRSAQWLASLLTFWSRKPVNPESVRRVFEALLWALKWFALPVILMGQGRRPRFWLYFAVILAVGWFVPQKLVHWAPDLKNTWLEVASLLLRWSVAYALAVACWLWTLREVKIR